MYAIHAVELEEWRVVEDSSDAFAASNDHSRLAARFFDHSIYLKPNAESVNIQSYGYPPMK